MRKIFISLLLVLLISNTEVSSQDNSYKMQSVFIVRFAKYIEWPGNYKSGDFQIGILGGAEAEKAISTTVQGKTVGSQKITVKRFNTVSEITPCNILYITFSKTSNFYAASTKVKGKSTLIITEKEGMAQKGSNINLVVNDGKMNFEINKSSTEKSETGLFNRTLSCFYSKIKLDYLSLNKKAKLNRPNF